jgi:hypothetical protein
MTEEDLTAKVVDAMVERNNELAAAFTVQYWMEWRKKHEDSVFSGGGIPEPAIQDKESGLVFENLYQYHAYWWGRDSLEGADRRVGEYQNKLVKALESICFDTDEQCADKRSGDQR